MTLSAAGSSDPDGHALTRAWFIYPEAGTFTGEVQLSSEGGEVTTLISPSVTQPQTIHVILRLTDNGVPALTSYRRAIIEVQP
jgi:hypothetical protein